MKTNFKFYFLLIITSAMVSSILYGLGQPLVEQYITIFSLGLLAITVIGISGMMRTLVTLAPVKVSSK
jgi:hypothetical protein